MRFYVFYMAYVSHMCQDSRIYCLAHVYYYLKLQLGFSKRVSIINNLLIDTFDAWLNEEEYPSFSQFLPLQSFVVSHFASLVRSQGTLCDSGAHLFFYRSTFFSHLLSFPLSLSLSLPIFFLFPLFSSCLHLVCPLFHPTPSSTPPWVIKPSQDPLVHTNDYIGPNDCMTSLFGPIFSDFLS